MTEPEAPAEQFLRAFRAAASDGRALEAMADDIDGFGAALASDPGALGAAIDAAGDGGGGWAGIAPHAFASAACSRDGRILASDTGFAGWQIEPRALAALVREAGSVTPRLSAIADDASGAPVAVAVATPARARGWPLAGNVRAVLDSGQAAFAVLGVHAGGLDWAQLFSPWNFSRAEGRLAAALVRTGDLRRAAATAGVAYETARETLATAMAKTGAPRQPAFVRQLAQLAFGEMAFDTATWQTFADAYDLSPRAARVAYLIGVGATRGTAATALGISDQSAKADLKLVFERCAVDGGAALGRRIAEVDALARLAAATDVEIIGRDSVSAPLRFIRRRRAEGRIAVEDHGPADGKPVVVFHVPVNGRHLPRVLVRAMQAAGLRPIAVDRPGFGLTSEAPEDLIAAANADLVDVLDALRLTRVRLLGRSLAMALAFAAGHPGRVSGGVLLAPTPPGTLQERGVIATFARLALNQPQLIAGFARMATRLTSEATIMRMTERTVGNAPTDLAALADPANRADWLRAARQSSSGNGFAREFRLHADGGAIPPGALATAWTVVFGSDDTMGVGIDDAVGLWRAAMPDARLVGIPGAGRLLHLSHPDEVAAALAAVGRR